MIETIITFLIIGVSIAVVIMANLGENSKKEREITYILLAFLCCFFIATGALIMLASMIDMPYPNEFKPNFIMGAGILFTGAFSIFLLFKNLRKIIAKFIPINPGSVVHAAGLVFAFIVIGSSLTIMFSTDMVSLLEESGGEFQINEAGILAQDAFFIVIALAGIGIFIRRTPDECIKRLNLTIPTAKQLIIGIILIPVFLAFVISYEFIMSQFYPGSAADIEKIMELLLGEPTLLLALIAGLGAGISEEILFRGAIQPRFGIPTTAFLFAVVHVQYPAFWVLIELFIIGVLLGYLKEKTNTTTCIITHSGYDIVVFLSLIYYY